MIKIPFSGNSKVIDLVLVTGLQGFIDITKKFQTGLCLLVPFTPGQTIQKMHYTLQEGRQKKANILPVLG